MNTRAYSTRQFRRAVNLSALLGWAGVVLFMACFAVPRGGIFILLGLLPYFAVVGLPMAFLLCWTVVAPVLWRLMKSPITQGRATFWGGATAAFIAAASIAIGRYRGWRQSLDDTSHSQVGGGDYVQSIDGILTPYGWQVLAINSALFIALGALVAFAVHRLIGPPQGKAG